MFPENKEDQEQNDINSRNNNIFANNNKKIIPPENGIGINQFPEKSDPVVKNEPVSPPAYLDPLTYEATPKQVEEPILGGGTDENLPRNNSRKFLFFAIPIVVILVGAVLFATGTFVSPTRKKLIADRSAGKVLDCGDIREISDGNDSIDLTKKYAQADYNKTLQDVEQLKTWAATANDQQISRIDSQLGVDLKSDSVDKIMSTLAQWTINNLKESCQGKSDSDKPDNVSSPFAH